MSRKNTEAMFEKAIVHELTTAGGYIQGKSSDFDKVQVLEPARVISFIRDTQDKQWQALSKVHSGGRSGRKTPCWISSAALCIFRLKTSGLPRIRG